MTARVLKWFVIVAVGGRQNCVDRERLFGREERASAYAPFRGGVWGGIRQYPAARPSRSERCVSFRARARSWGPC